MIRPIVKDIFFLGQKSEEAIKQALPVGQENLLLLLQESGREE
jgi:hypothetical protein